MCSQGLIELSTMSNGSISRYRRNNGILQKVNKYALQPYLEKSISCSP
jgi:hypothetical protein